MSHVFFMMQQPLWCLCDMVVKVVSIVTKIVHCLSCSGLGYEGIEEVKSNFE